MGKKIYILGKNSFIGNGLNKKLNYYSEIINANEFINKKPNELYQFKKQNELVIIDCAGVTRGSENEFFGINFVQKLEIIKKICLIKEKYKESHVKYLYFGSIHSKRDDLYGYSKRFTKFLIDNYLTVNNINNKIIQLCGIYGPGVSPHKYSVVATFYHNILNNKKCVIMNDEAEIQLEHIDEIIDKVNCYIQNEDKNEKMEIDLFEEVKGDKITVRKLHTLILKLSKNLNFDDEIIFYKELKRELRKYE